MKLHDLSPLEGSKKESKRIGRGHGSGHGKTSGKGHKGQKARSGWSMRAGFEGGQMPLQRRIPKRGFNNIFGKKISIVNLAALNIFENDSVVDVQAIIDAGIVKKEYDGIKILGNGKLNKKLTVKVSYFSESSRSKIEAIGGKAEVI